MTNNVELISINNKIDTLFDKLEKIDCKLEKLLEIMNHEIKNNCDKMGNHIDFIESVYSKVRTPLGFICSRVNYLINYNQDSINLTSLPEN